MIGSKSIQGSAGTRVLFAVGTVLLLVFQGMEHGEAAVGQVGTVDTLAGPNLCEGDSTLNPGFAEVGALAADASGRVFVETGSPREGLVKKISSDASVSVAYTGLGTGAAQRRGEGDIRRPGRLAASGEGGVFFAADDHLLYLDEGPITVAGTPNVKATARRSAGDGGPAAAATFKFILSISSDAQGNVYLADEIDPRRQSFRIRFINRGAEPKLFYPGTTHARSIGPGEIGTVAGGSAKDRSGPFRTLRGRPPSMTAGPRVLYLATSRSGGSDRTRIDVFNTGEGSQILHGMSLRAAAVRRLSTAPSTEADGPQSPSYVSGMSTDVQGNLYLADKTGNRILRVDSVGKTTVFAGRGEGGKGPPGFNGNDRRASTASLNRPMDVKAVPDGFVYISDTRNHQVRFVDNAGIIRAAPGNGLTSPWECRFKGSPSPKSASLLAERDNPAGVAESSGKIYFTTESMQIKRRSRGGTVVRVLAGRRDLCDAEERCRSMPVATPFHKWGSLVPGPAGGLYVVANTDAGGSVRLYNPESKPLTAHGVRIRPGMTKAVIGKAISAGGSKAPPVDFGEIGAIAAGRRGSLFFAELNEGKVFRLAASGAIETLVDKQKSFSSEQCCRQVAGLVADRFDNLYVSDRWSGRVWYLNRQERPVIVHGQRVEARALRPVAGSTKQGIGGDGVPASEARFGVPEGLALDRQGNLYIVDVQEHVVRKVNPAGLTQTVAGTGIAGFNGDGLKGPLTALSSPLDLAIDRCGNLLIADSQNDRIRRLNLSGLCR